MTCLLKTEENKQLLNKYTKIVGSEDAAYYLLCANNGYELNQTPNGEDSALYAQLMQLYKDENKSILAKAQAYLPEMGDWVDHPEDSDLTLDQYGEPSIKYLVQDADNDPLFANTTFKAEDITSLLQDEGRLNRTLEVLTDNNMIDRSVAIENAVRYGRDSFVYKYIEELSKYEDISPVRKYLHSKDARREWDERMLPQIVNRIQQHFADTFNLKRVEKDGAIYFEGDDNSQTGKVRIQFVNNLQKFFGKEASGAYNEDVNHMMSDLYISLETGDHSTIVHELAHRYIRNYWETQPVQDALKVLQKRKDKNVIEIEERLVNKLVKALETDENLFNKFWSKLNKFLSKVFSFPNKKEIVDDLVAFFSINKDLSDLAAETVFFSKIYEPVFQSVASSKKESKLLEEIKKAVDVRIKALTHEPIRNNKVISELKSTQYTLEDLDSTNPDDIELAVRGLLSQCEEELNDVRSIMAKAELEGLDKLDIGAFSRLKTNTIGYYHNMLESKINNVFDNNSQNDSFKVGSDLYHYWMNVKNLLAAYSNAYERIANNWVDWYIDTSAEQLVTFADQEIWKVNAKHWVRNEIANGGLGYFNKLFGAINSESPIINLIDFLVRKMKNSIEPLAEHVGHKLTSLYDSYTNHADILPINGFRAFCEHGYKRDANGRHTLTGNFRRSENYGEMQAAVDKKKIQTAKKLGIELDENLQFDYAAVTRDQYNQFYDELDDFYEDNDILRQYAPEYYRIQRKYLSPETIEYRKRLQQQINLLETKCKNQQTGIIEIFNLTADERQHLKDLREQKYNLSNPYDIVQDEHGNIISIDLKDPDSREGRMAEELILFSNAIRGKVKYISDRESYQKDLDTLKRQGAKGWQIAMFEQENTQKKIRDDVFQTGRPRTQELAELYAQRQAIINATKPEKGYSMPDLSRLNDDAWRELQEIDNMISELEKEIIEAGGALPSGYVNPNADVANLAVSKYENGVPTGTSYLDYIYQEQVINRAAINPNADQEFYDKYYYTKWNKDKIAGEWTSSRVPLTAFYTIIVNNPEFTPVDPIGKYTKPVGSLVESEYNPQDNQYLQPKPFGKWHDYEFDKLYGDGSTKYAKLYDYMIQIMGEIYKNYGMVDTNKYQLPGIRDDEFHSLHRSGYFTISNFKELWGLNETDTSYNEETQIRPDGTIIHTIPIRWIAKLKNPNLTSTDLIKTIVAMYYQSLNYKEKNEVLPMIEMMMIPMGMGFSNPRDAELPDQVQFIKQYIDQYIYERSRKIGKHNKIWVNKLADTVMHKAHSKLMSHNWKVVIKNAVDSFWNFTKEMAGGKYFTVIDSLASHGVCIKNILNTFFRNIGIANTKDLTCAIMNRNGIDGSVSEIFKGQRSTGVRRFLAKHFAMGEYSLIDYVWKGHICDCIYHNHRLIVNPLTGKQQFMNKWQAAYAYSRAGLTEKKGIKAWSKAGRLFGKGVTMLDAVYVDKLGQLQVKDEYLDIVRPEINGRRDNTLETRIESIIHERVAVINGYLDEMDRPEMLTNTIGCMVAQMRGWMFSQSADNFKNAHQFRVLEKDLDELGFEANDGKNYYEDEEFVGIANLSTGFMERGATHGLLSAYGRIISTLITLGKLKKFKPTKQNKYQAKMMSVSLLSMAVTIALSVLFGKMVEDDDDDLVSNFLYAVNAGAMSERVSQLPYGVTVSMLELIRSIAVSKSMYDDFGSVGDCIIDAGQYIAYKNGIVNTKPYEDKVKRGGYTGVKDWQKDVMKATSVLVPEININNIFKNFSNDANVSSANFYNQNWPINWFNYIPKRGAKRTRTSITTWLTEGSPF